MPQIPMISDRSRPGVLTLPQASPEHFGAQVGRGASEFGQALAQMGQKIQDQQDETALIEKVASYNARLTEIPREILDDLTIAPGQRYKQFHLNAQAHRRTLEAGASSAVVRALGNHEQKALSQAVVRFQADDMEGQINTARVALMESQAKSGEREAFELANGNPGLAQTERKTRHDALARAEVRRMITPMERQAAEEREDHRKFELLAQQNPRKMLELVNDSHAGKASEIGLDPTKAVYYGNLAVNRLHSLDGEKQSKAKADEDAFKANQIVAKNDFYARMLRGEHVPASWYEQNKVALGDKFDEVAKDGIAMNIKGGPGAGSDHIGQWEKRILVDNEVGDEARRKIFADPRLSRDQRRDLEAVVRKRETEMESGKDAKYFANEPRFKDYEVRVKRLLGDAPWLPILRPADQRILGEAIVELRSRVEAASLGGGEWQTQIPEIAAQVLVHHQPRLSGGVATPKDWQGTLEKSMTELQKEFSASGKGKADAALVQNPEYRRRATQLLTYDAYVQRFPARQMPSSTPSKGAQETKPPAIQELFQKLLESSAEEHS